MALHCATVIMKHKNEKLCAGVCMDNLSAVIITNNDTPESSEYVIQQTIKSPADHSSGSEHTRNNAKHADTIKYFKSVATQLLSFDEILIFGAGMSQEQFQNHLKEDAQFNNKKISIDSAEHLTDPQKIAVVRDFFRK